MKSDIDFPKVKNVAVAVQPLQGNGENWKVLLLNENEFPINNVLVTSKGYGEKDGEKEQTSILRHFFEQVPSKDFVEVESIIPDVFELFNEYWVSYYIDGHIHDKKFIFVPGSLNKKNLTWIDLIKAEGILHP